MKKYTHLNEVSIDESFSDSGFVLGVDENGDIKRVPRGIMGKIKSINGEQPNENGDIKVCEVLKDVGEQCFEHITIEGSDEPRYDFRIGSWTGTDMPDLYYIMGGDALEGNPEIRCFKVILDNVTYICPTHLVQEDGTKYIHQYIGNGSMMFEDEEDNGLPFIICYDEYRSGVWCGKVASDGEHNCQIYGGVYATVQVPEELVPQKVIVINKSDLSNHKATEIIKLLKSGKMVHIVEYYDEEGSWKTYVPSGWGSYEDDYLRNGVVFTSLFSVCSASIMDFPGSINSVTYQLGTIILYEGFENGYATFDKILTLS